MSFLTFSFTNGISQCLLFLNHTLYNCIMRIFLLLTHWIWSFPLLPSGSILVLKEFQIKIGCFESSHRGKEIWKRNNKKQMASSSSVTHKANTFRGLAGPVYPRRRSKETSITNTCIWLSTRTATFKEMLI